MKWQARILEKLPEKHTEQDIMTTVSRLLRTELTRQEKLDILRAEDEIILRYHSKQQHFQVV